MVTPPARARCATMRLAMEPIKLRRQEKPPPPCRRVDGAKGTAELFAPCLYSNPGARGVPFRAPHSTRSLPILLAVAADALINPVVLLFDPAVEGPSGRALRLARMGSRLSRRSQKLLVQQSRGLVVGRRANASGTVRLSLSREGSDGGHEQQTKIQPFQHWILLSAKR